MTLVDVYNKTPRRPFAAQTPIGSQKTVTVSLRPEGAMVHIRDLVAEASECVDQADVLEDPVLSCKTCVTCTVLSLT